MTVLNDVEAVKKVSKKQRTVVNSKMEIDEDSKTMEIDDKKVVKKQKKAKKRKAETPDESTSEAKKKSEPENDLTEEKNNADEEEPEDEDEATESQKISDKEASQLTGKYLRTSFNSDDGLSTLKKFVSVCNEKKKLDLAAQYLSAGGSALEILKLLETGDKKNLGNATNVFAAMEIVVMKILEKYPQYNSSAAEACRYLLNSHLSSIHSMLSSQSNAKQRRVVLRLLTAVVSLGGNLPRELLGHLSLHPQVLDTLTRHTQPGDVQSVRTSFVHFVLSFLVEGNVSVIRALLDKRGVVSSIFPELMYDSHQLVNLVFTTIRSYVLENQAISKTIKLHTFSTPVVQSLVSLYNWKGPRNWPGPRNRKKQQENSGHTDPEEKKIVVEAVHDFLLTLLTSNKFGIIFHDRSLGTSGRKNNQLANTILQSLDRPWEHAKPGDLVVRILVACPDLVKPQLASTEPFLDPTESKKWILLMEFVQQIVESLDPEVCLKPCLSELTTQQLFSALTTLTVPLIILKKATAPAIGHDSVAVRHTAVVLLVSMLKQLRNFLNTIKVNVEAAEVEKIEHLVTDYVSKHIPSLDAILDAWNKALMNQDKETATVPLPSLKETLASILDLLLTYQEVTPQLLEINSTSKSGGDSTSLLTGLSSLDDIGEEELGDMKVKALQFLLALNSSAFTPEKDLFAEAVPFLISLLGASGESTVSDHARKAIKQLFNASGVFEGCEYQIDIWINSCFALNTAKERIELANWLVKIIRKTTKHAATYMQVVTKAEEMGGEQLYSRTTIEDIFADLMERDVEIGRNKTAKLLPTVSIGPLLVAALANIERNATNLLLDYLSRVTVNVLHSQVSPNALIHLVSEVEKLPSRPYVSSWMPGEEHVCLNDPFHAENPICKLSKALITHSRIEVDKIFEGSRRVSFELDGEEISFAHSMNADELTAAFRLSIFYFTRLTQEEKMTDELYEDFKIVVLALLHVAKDLEAGIIAAEWILSHPAMLQYFSPLYKKKNIVERYSTEMMAEISPWIVRLFGSRRVSDLLIPFKDKFITKIMSAAKKIKENKNVKDCPGAVRFVEILQLDVKDICELLTAAIELPIEKIIDSDKTGLSMWGLVVPELLKASLIQSESETVAIDKSLMEKISQSMSKLGVAKIEGLDLWTESVLAYLKRFPHNIDGIDKNFFISLIKGETSPLRIELASFLLTRNTKFIPTYIKYSLQNEKSLKNKEAVFKILASMPDDDIQPQFLTKLGELYKDEVLGWFKDPETVETYVKKNVKAAVRLIETVIDAETCQKTCEMILSNGDKLLTVDESYIDLLNSVFSKAGKMGTDSGSNLVDFTQILIHIAVSALKKDSKNTEKHNSLCQTLLDVLKSVKTSESSSPGFHEIKKNHSWPQFTRFSLKLGLKSSKDVKTGESKLLKTLVRLCDVVYEDNDDDEYVKTLFEMTTSHSEFINVMLGASAAKRDLVELILVLVRKNNSLMASTHVPLYLGAYNATLGETDQLILQLLQYYEGNSVKLTDYRPYLWGSAAASHYSVKSGADTALWRQPSTSQVLDLFLSETVNNTVRNYPVRRKMKNTELDPPQQTYDPAFYLPLLSYLLSDNSVVACHKITQSGGLALALSACGSTEKQTRLAAFTVISRFYYHLEATNSKEKLLWMHFIDIFRNGISSSTSELEETEISCLVTTFMAQTSLVATQPLNPLYSPLQNFLMAKPSLDLTTIPEFLQLFHSSDVDYKLHRFWILEVVRDGLKTSVDAEVAFRCVLFKMLLDFYSCCLADARAKNLILQVINSATKIQNACLLLVTGYGLLPWLNEILFTENDYDSDFVTVFVSVGKNVYESLSRSNDKNEDLYFMLFKALIDLKQHLSSKNTDVESYKNYIITCDKILSIKPLEFSRILTTKDVQDLVKLGKNILNEVNECQDILQFGSKFSNKHSITLICENDSITLAKNSLKHLLIVWSSSKDSV